MEEAKTAVQNFMSKDGHHDTTVHEHLKPAVTHEHITPTQHVNTTTAIDREVHQDHHHTSIQPIRHREIMPEQHVHNLAPVEHKELQHGDPTSVKERLAQEAAQFKDVSETGKVEHTYSTAPVVQGEHVHHHVHEYIQPVIQKETVQPTIIHTTVPVHEVHHNQAKHHAASALPAVSLTEWKKAGGSLTGREGRTDRFEGQPQSETAEQHARHGGIHLHGIDGTEGTSDTSRTNKTSGGRDAAVTGAAAVSTAAVIDSTRRKETATTTTAQAKTSPVDSRIDSKSPNSPTSPASSGTRSSRYSGVTDRTSLSSDQGSKFADTHLGSKMDEASAAKVDGQTLKTGSALRPDASKGTETKRKSSLLQRLNPLTDADGDGRKGIMT